MTTERPPETKATKWLKARRAPPEPPPERSRRRRSRAGLTIVVAAVAYSAFRVFLGLDIITSFLFAAVGALTIAFAFGWFD